VAAALAVTAAACSKSPTEPSGDPRITLQPGQTASVGPERTALTFERVAYDQRCPWNAACVAFADTHALLVFRVGGHRAPGSEERLRAGGLTPGHLHVPGAVLTIAELKPDPWAPFDWPHSDYRVTLDVAAE
jgi:hypothetical protein